MKKTITLSLEEFKRIESELDALKNNKIKKTIIISSSYFYKNIEIYEFIDKESEIVKFIDDKNRLLSEIKYLRTKTFLQKLKDLFK
jgi:hypothetical protein